jgi:hypothetical protein
MRATCHAHLTVLDLIVLRGEIFAELKAWPSLCIFVYPSVILSVLGELKHAIKIEELSHLFNSIEVLRAPNVRK